MSTRKLILYIAMSLDGYIAADNDSLEFLSAVEQPGQDYGYGDFITAVDTVILGRRTYEHILSMGIPYPHVERMSYVVTRSARPDTSNVTFYTGNLKELVQKLKNEDGKNIFCDGGAVIVNLLMKEDLIDEYIISIIPVLLGGGIALFSGGRPQEQLSLVSSVSFPTGLVQVHYVKKS